MIECMDCGTKFDMVAESMTHDHMKSKPAKMNVKTGLKGIRKFLAEDASGWHIHIDNDYDSYHTGPVSQVFDTISRRDGKHTFTGWIGNCLFFTAVDQ